MRLRWDWLGPAVTVPFEADSFDKVARFLGLGYLGGPAWVGVDSSQPRLA